MREIAERVKNIISEKSDHPVENITDASHLQIARVGDIVKLVEKKTTKQRADGGQG